MEPATKPSSAVQAGPPPNGTANGVHASQVATQTAASPRSKSTFVRILEVVADLRITVGLFALAMLIVFWGTLAQADQSVWNVQRNYFRSFLAWIPLRVMLFNCIDSNGPAIFFPGGLLIGAVMMANLLAAHAIRFKLAWNRGGIILIHVGIIVMLVSEVITHLYAVEGSMIIKIGRTVNAVSHTSSAEFAVVKTIDSATDEVVTVPQRFLKPGDVIDDPRLPFIVEVTRYLSNSTLDDPRPNEVPLNAKGQARFLAARELKEVAGVSTNQKVEYPAMYAKLKGATARISAPGCFRPCSSSRSGSPSPGPRGTRRINFSCASSKPIAISPFIWTISNTTNSPAPTRRRISTVPYASPTRLREL